MKVLNTVRRMAHDADVSVQTLAEIREGIANQSALVNQKLSELIGVFTHMSNVQQDQGKAMAKLLSALIQNQNVDTRQIASFQKELTEAASFQRPPAAVEVSTSVATGNTRSSFKQAMANIPLLLDEKTYNTSHPDYDATAVRNYPGTIFNYKKASANRICKDLLRFAQKDQVPDKAWDAVLKETLAEAKTVPHAEQVFERMDFTQAYMDQIAETHGAHYRAGWVNLEDALFLYWLVRKLKPKTIVQTGVCNGLSSAFMMLALAKNGPDGKLYVIDLAAIFNPKDPAWTVKDKVYGVVIPEGRDSGWLVPDAYRDRFEVHQGDAKKLLPPLLAKLPSIDMFYHDSDHTYNHMMFEFREAKKKLNPGGLIVGDDISWNASVWDFADEHAVPSYNYKGAVGVAFF